MAAECRCTEREFGRCSRPTVRPGRNVHDERDHGEPLRHPPARPADERLADRNPRSRLAGLAGTVRRVGEPAHDPMPAGRDRPSGQARPRRVHRVRRTQSTPMAIRPVSSTMRATRPSCQVARRHGPGTRPPGRSCDGRDAAGARGRGSWPTAPMISTWPGWSTVSRPSLGSSHRVREQPPARRGGGARIVTGPHEAHRQDPHRPRRDDAGRPRAVIRFRISQPRTTALPCLAGLRARRLSPMMDVSRKHVFSTRP